jgi:hypothetical protein
MVYYSLDLSLISLDRFFQLTRSKRMLPGRVMLQEMMEERFAILVKAGITDLKILNRQLGSKQKMESFSARWDLPYPYLVLLNREVGSYQAKPKPLSDFPGVPFEYTERLGSIGIRNTRDFYELASSERKRSDLASKTGIPEARLSELYALCDLSRITGVGGAMARFCYEERFRSVTEFATAEPQQFSKFPEEDIQYCIHYARVIVECELKSET